MALPEKKISVGIDLGTTYCSIGYFDEITNSPVVVSVNNLCSVPSWVNYSQIDKGNLLVGISAKDDTNENMAIFDVKRLIGRPVSDVIKDTTKIFPFTIVDYPGTNSCGIQITDPRTDKPKTFLPEQISALVLKYLYSIVQDNLVTKEIERVVIGTPSDFGPHQIQATKNAATLAGIEVPVFTLQEPSCAVLEYLREAKIQDLDNKVFAVVDFGGGTLDVAFCRIINGKIDVFNCGGDQNIGGNDFDLVMIEILKQKIEEIAQDEGLGVFFDKTSCQLTTIGMMKKARRVKLRKLAESVKIQLTTKKCVEIELGNYFNEIKTEDTLNIDRDTFYQNEKFKTILDNAMEVINKFVKSSGTKPNQIEKVLLTGGTCLMPPVRDAIINIFDKNNSKNKVLCFGGNGNFDPLTMVCKGASYYSFMQNDTVSLETKIESAPYSLGFEVSESLIDVFLAQDEKIPKEFVKKYIVNPQVSKFKLCVYKGPKEVLVYSTAAGVKFVTSMSVEIPPQPKRQKIVVKGIVDEECLLHFEVSIEGSPDKPFEVQLSMVKTSAMIERLKKDISDFFYS
ncbi:chaperone protein DNAK, putative [Entamoeba invadens IP1]|uniref:Chaperone protein DNAK, putative n=1 Tax=Entamoeba invadens IP1 TaxID=370355 RepID=A0A0A1UC43_ENTIV|nr:chaperone protein DNAK, putative [Entamoeba invadens IP1]ELP92816.1 chaperone protein DNAK, putative [Entamoeba invadens IP1]|eukprot:XP_004259587.1 chaperone protein DNAK, putative [Entamoeba invadens IP1]